MTWADWIAAAIVTAFALLITIHQHRSTTQPKHIRRTENGHDRSDTHREKDR